MIENAVNEALQTMKKGMVFAGKEYITDGAVPMCQIFRNKLISFYLDKEEFEPHYRASFEWKGNVPIFTPGLVTHSEILLENRDSKIFL
jgi:hypothetical protein